MTPRSGGRSPVSSTRIFAVAGVRVRRVLRTRLALAALILALMPWLLVDSASFLPRVSSLAEFTLVGLTMIGAGAPSDDIDSGEFAIVLTHECSPLDVLAGQAVASFLLTAILVVLQLPIAFAGIVMPNALQLVFVFAWLAALLVSWLGLLLLLATILEGKANAVAMIGVLALVPLLQAGSLVDRLPRSLAAIARGPLELLPQLEHATSMFSAAVGGPPAPAVAPLVLLLSPVVYFTLAAVRIYRLEPAGRLTQ